METDTTKEKPAEPVAVAAEPAATTVPPVTHEVELADWQKVKAEDKEQTNTADPVADEFKAAMDDSNKTAPKPTGKTSLEAYKGVAFTAHWMLDEVYATVTNAFRVKDVEIDHKGGLQVNNKAKFDAMVQSLAELLHIEQVQIPALMKWIFYGGAVLLSYRELWELQGKEIAKAKDTTAKVAEAKKAEDLPGWKNVSDQNTKEPKQ
jgi:hypothetical protein